MLIPVFRHLIFECANAVSGKGSAVAVACAHIGFNKVRRKEKQSI